jgi:hypothetical protein
LAIPCSFPLIALSLIMPALVADIHVFMAAQRRGRP